MSAHLEKIAQLKAQAKYYRELTKQAREEVARLKAVQKLYQDRMAILRAEVRVTECLRAAQNREAAAAEIRSAFALAVPA